jgi:hypothetical protein
MPGLFELAVVLAAAALILRRRPAARRRPASEQSDYEFGLDLTLDRTGW